MCAGLDAVVVMELDDEALAVKRALGRRVDPLTGRVYHLEFDAPPPKEPGLAARLKAGFSEPRRHRLASTFKSLIPVSCNFMLISTLCLVAPCKES